MIKNIAEKELAQILLEFQGAYAEVWKYTVSHKKIAMKFSIPDRMESLYLLATSCEFISGKLSWHCSNLEYNCNPVVDSLGDVVSEIRDTASGFKLVASDSMGFLLVSDDEVTFLTDF